MNATVMKELETLCKELEQLTWDNEHTGALMRIAEYFVMTDYYAIFRAIETIHDAERCMPFDLSGYRHRKAKQMMAVIKERYGKEVHDKIYSSL